MIGFCNDRHVSSNSIISSSGFSSLMVLTSFDVKSRSFE
jgi:hypothetical protein